MKPVFRSSELDRILSCNGSITLCALVDPRQGDEGDEGSAIHHAVATRLINELGAIPPEGGLPPAPAHKIATTSQWIVGWIVRHVQEMIPSDWSLMVEVPLAYEFDRWISSGHIDVLAISPDGTESIGMDYKTGRDPVDPAENNEQCAQYCVLQKRAWDTIRKATFQIVQPRVAEDEEEGIQRVSTVVIENLDALVTTMDARVGAAIDNNMELHPGRKQCRWCPAALQCDALKLIRSQMKLMLTKEGLAKIRRTPDDGTLGDWVIDARMLAQPMKDATELLHSRLDETALIVTNSGATITREIGKGGYEIEKPTEFFKAAHDILKSDERMGRVFKPSLTRLTDEIAEELNINRGGAAAITAEGIVGAQFKPYTKQQQKRMLIVRQ